MELNRRAFLASLAATPLAAQAIQHPAPAVPTPQVPPTAGVASVRSGYERVTFTTKFSNLILGEPVCLTIGDDLHEYVVIGMELTAEMNLVVTADRRLAA